MRRVKTTKGTVVALTMMATAVGALGAQESRHGAVAERRAAQEMEWALAHAQAALAGSREPLAVVEARLASTRHALRSVSAEAELAAVGARLHAMGPRLEAMATGLDAVAIGLDRGRRSAPVIPEAWLPQDPADSVYRAARELLNREQYQQAAARFRDIRSRFPRSGYVGDSYYFQALALQRAGGTARLEEAVSLLGTMLERHAGAATAGEARTLRVRIQGQLARRGNAEAAAQVARQAEGSCDSEDQELRAAAMSALIHMQSESAVPLLQEVLRSRDECSAELRKQAVFLLSQKMDAGTVDLLLDLAHRNPDPDPEVREAAVFWLSQVRSEEALDALESILRAPGADEQIQEKAVFAVSQHRSPRSVEILKGYAERGDAPMAIRENAIFWLGQKREAGGAAYLRELYGRLQDDELKEKVIFGVAQTRNEENTRWLLALARNRDESVELRKNALFWAGQSGAVPVGDLRSIYASMPDREMKEQVIFVLSQKRAPEAVDALMEIARDEEDSELRERAIFWLGQSKDPRVAEFLLQIVRGGGG